MSNILYLISLTTHQDTIYSIRLTFLQVSWDIVRGLTAAIPFPWARPSPSCVTRVCTPDVDVGKRRADLVRLGPPHAKHLADVLGREPLRPVVERRVVLERPGPARMPHHVHPSFRRPLRKGRLRLGRRVDRNPRDGPRRPLEEASRDELGSRPLAPCGRPSLGCRWGRRRGVQGLLVVPLRHRHRDDLGGLSSRSRVRARVDVECDGHVGVAARVGAGHQAARTQERVQEERVTERHVKRRARGTGVVPPGPPKPSGAGPSPPV